MRRPLVIPDQCVPRLSSAGRHIPLSQRTLLVGFTRPASGHSARLLWRVSLRTARDDMTSLTSVFLATEHGCRHGCIFVTIKLGFPG